MTARATTLGYRISAAVHRVHSVAVLPLDFGGRLRILRTMHLPAALHGVEASLVSVSGLRKLRTAFSQAAMSGGLRLANPGAILSLLDGPVVSDPGFHVVWCPFRIQCMSLPGSIVFYGLSLPVLLGMVRFIYC